MEKTPRYEIKSESGLGTRLVKLLCPPHDGDNLSGMLLEGEFGTVCFTFTKSGFHSLRVQKNVRDLCVNEIN